MVDLRKWGRAVGEEHVRPARVHVPVVLDMGLGVVDRPDFVFQSARAHDLGPALLGRGVELIGPSLDQRRLAQPAIDRSGHVRTRRATSGKSQARGGARGVDGRSTARGEESCGSAPARIRTTSMQGKLSGSATSCP